MTAYDYITRSVLDQINAGKSCGKVPAVILLGEREYWILRNTTLLIEAHDREQVPSTFYGVPLFFTDDASLLMVKMHSPIVKPPRG